ncbi:major facilitator superfamily domain-containing protein [Massariosphaeria phaeospora]|uniref:Major facilitator superfamily domain-containing protein n=1 Tax=Massariosphaeria phaeospora TaxID=100035 RepID=A0A7C8I551_9PLEO|nr:major facilitator superfamily domain-containing protein [Massariosphaeria phaeospora]
MSHGPRFWGIFVALCLLAFISVLDVAVITIALPRITAEIGSAEQDYVWIANSFVVASSVIQPLVGQLANILGRRIPLIVATTLVGMLIAGRTVQGVGAGAIYVLLDILGLMNSWSGVAAGIGPVIVGALAEANWRWIFYMNIPICALALGAVLMFMHVKAGGGATGVSKVRQIDWLGNTIFISSMIALLLGLVMGGIQHPCTTMTKYPSIPARLFSNRTSATAYILTFLSSILVQSGAYFLPVWFQAVLGITALRSGTYFLPFAIGTLFFAVVGGVLLSKFGTYRPIHAATFALSAIGFGLFTILDPNSNAKWAIFQLIASAGLGMTLSTMLPAIMVGLPESDVAASAAVYSFVRTFGYIWGVTMPSIIFNAVFNKNLHLISSADLRDRLKNGAAYSFASQAHRIRGTLDARLWSEVVEVYSRSLNVIWWVGLGISIIGFFGVAGERDLGLRKDLELSMGSTARKKQPARRVNNEGNYFM